MRIHEMFVSIQGEGNYIGMPCIFVRTQGCNLHCPFCDTKETWKEEAELRNMQSVLTDIVRLSHEHNIKLVVITGGEPCLQPDLQDLIDQLMVREFRVCIETNGTQATPSGCWVTASPKPENSYAINPACRPNELKYVVTEEFDESIITDGIREAYAGRIWLQPDGYNMQKMWMKCYNMAMNDPRLRVGVQLHKLMEVK